MSPVERLVGRHSVMAATGSVLGDVLAGAGQLLLVGGEAGIGKTAVLAALINQAEPDWFVLQGFCWEGSGARPYWPWSQVLQASGLSRAQLGEAGWLLDTASESAERTTPTGSMSAAAATDAQFRLFEAVSGCLKELAVDRPLLVVIDDLDWADEPSVRLLGFLARALASSRVLLAGAYRDTEASTGLLSLAGSAQQLMLAGLAPDDVAAMIEDMAGSETSPQVSSQLWQRSGGNPFFVRELTRLLLAQGPWHEHTHIPASVAETLRRRLARLSTPCVRLLDWAAVAGRDIDTALLVCCGAATDEAEALGLLDEARRAGVIVGHRDDPRFAHDLYRETILDGLSPSMTADINLSVGQALQEQPGTAAQVASHFLAAGPRARRSAIDYSILAAREATARLGHEDACAHYLRALRLIDSAGDRNTDDRAEILLELAAAYERAGSTILLGVGTPRRQTPASTPPVR